MPCYHPIDAWQPKPGAKLLFSFLPPPAVYLQIACGKCIGCKLEYSRQWALRCVHEASLYERNCFITLTFNDKYRPADGSLDVRTIQLFIKRFRRAIYPQKLRYFYCGEYGEACATCGQNLEQCSRSGCVFIPTFGHPHYHLCIFGFDFIDRYRFKSSRGVDLYRSPTLEKLWTYVDPVTKRDTGESLGFSTIGDVTFESAAYIARYTCKKITGDMADNHYTVVDGSTGEIIKLKPEFVRMSTGGRTRKGGIASDWYSKNKGDLRKDFITRSGKKMRGTKFYDKKFEQECLSAYIPATFGPTYIPVNIADVNAGSAFDMLKAKRKAQAIENSISPEQLSVKEKIKLRRAALLKRGIES